MSARICSSVAALVGALLGDGCSCLFPYGPPNEHDAGPPTRDAGPDALPDAALDSGRDAGLVDPCGPDFPLEDREPGNCRCGEPCGPRHPFCCAQGCCTEECGAVPNDCSFDDEDPIDAGPWDGGWFDATTPERVDGGCDPFEHDSCLGCGVPCPDSRPFCCGAICCSDECGSFGRECSTSPVDDDAGV